MYFFAYIPLVITVTTLFFLLVKLWNFVNLYKEFPQYRMFPLVLIASAFRKIPFNVCVFQLTVFLAKRFQKEGIYLLWLPKPHVVVYGEEAAKIFSNEQAAQDKASKYEELRESFGSGLVTSNGEIWRTHRKMLNPVFHVGVLKNKVPIFNDSAKILIQKLQAAENESSIDVLELLKTCSFGILCEYVLGLKMNTPENKEAIENYIKIIAKGGEMMVDRFLKPWLKFKFIKEHISSGKKYAKMKEQLDNFTLEIVSAMKKNIVSQQEDITCVEDEWSDDATTRKSFAHILLNHHLKDNSFTMEDVKSQVITFMAAGFDTVAYALMWNLFMLGHDPDAQNQAYNEVMTLSEENIKYEDLHKLKYLECVIKETLRLYPPIPLYGRKLNKDVQCGKYKVPKGTEIVFFPYALHRNPEVYPDPEKFCPARFLEDNFKQLAGNHIPFSEGIRNCIGKRFAMMEMKVILAYILRNFKITSLDKREEVELSWSIVLEPARPLQFQFTPRK